jgi:RNA polymerase sigma-70 factor (ECF subfamily)
MMRPMIEEILPAGGERELLARIRGGDAAAFAALMRQNNRRLYRLARGILKDENEAEEAVQESYLRAFVHLGRFKGEASLATWLARIVANEALGRLRRRRPGTEITALTAADMPIGAGADPEHAAARREIRKAIEKAIDTLPAAFRTVFMLRAVEQLSIKETAEFLGIPEDTVKTRFHRANDRLRRSLSKEFASIWDDAFPFAGERCNRMVAAVLARIAGARAVGGSTTSIFTPDPATQARRDSAAKGASSANAARRTA